MTTVFVAYNKHMRHNYEQHASINILIIIIYLFIYYQLSFCYIFGIGIYFFFLIGVISTIYLGLSEMCIFGTPELYFDYTTVHVSLCQLLVT